jgi:NADH:ubiquinone oxidoreductase subunit 5 (subunit L)/multisubunit Na+/H+ antiporter MnhA subunit
MKKILFAVMIALTILFASLLTIAYAGEGTDVINPLGDAVHQLINGTVIPMIVSIVGVLLSMVLLKLKKKFNVQIAAETETWIQNQAENAVQMVAEKAAAKLKYNDLKLTPSQKLDTAIASLITKVPEISKEQADVYVHAALARIKGEGATGNSLTAEK